MKNELKNGQRFLGIDKQQTTNNKPQTIDIDIDSKIQPPLSK